MGGSSVRKERHEGIVPNKGLGGAEPGLATQEGKRLSSASIKATASRRAPRCTTCASEARTRQRRLKIGACMTSTATSGVASAQTAVCKARGYRLIEGCVKKVRLKRGRDSERTRSCPTADHSNGSLRGARSKPTRPTPTTSVQGTKKHPKPRVIEKRQTARSCISKGHRKVYGATICEWAHKKHMT